jgi:hypothetical protein
MHCGAKKTPGEEKTSNIRFAISSLCRAGESGASHIIICGREVRSEHVFAKLEGVEEVYQVEKLH